jgi:hypothetical protein
MKSISKLKDEARRYEQREEWEKAIQAYLQVIRNADEGEAEVELPLYNRVGDLCVRLGKPQEAVRHYEQAADRYAEAGLFNNAIALCNKALRYNPDRLELIRKLGQFSASQGFITDARRYFLDYAERQFNAGKVTEALSALEDFANVSEDPDIREMLGRQLHAHGRINDAVDELRRAHALRLRDGDTQQAEVLRAEILAIDPNAGIDGGAAAPVGSPRVQDQGLPLVEIEPEPPADTSSAEELVIDSGDVPADGVVDATPMEIHSFDTDLADIQSGDAIDGLETTTFDFGEADQQSGGLSDLGLERDESTFGTGGGRDAETFELPEPAEASFDLPTLDEPESTFDLPTLDEPESTFDLPTLDEPDSTFDLPLLDEDGSGQPDVEATPLPPLSMDDEPATEATGLADETDMGLGGDLPLDLSSFSGFGNASFELPTSDDEAAAEDQQDEAEEAAAEGAPPAWETSEEEYDAGATDAAIELPTWEPEPGPEFELPSFDAGENDAEVEDITSSLAEDGQDAGVLEIPAIELPTWDTAPLPADEAETTAESADEPVWVEATRPEEEESPTELPTFTYEEEPESEVEAEERTADGDPLGLGAHLPGHVQPEAAAPEDETDWLDDIADDEPTADPVAAELHVEDVVDDDAAVPDATAS